jgi:hypothetical protein
MHLTGEWGDMESELADVELTMEDDSVRWALTSHGQFIVHWSFPGVRNLKMEEL